MISVNQEIQTSVLGKMENEVVCVCVCVCVCVGGRWSLNAS